jgi:alpha,alpha-trehalase
VQGLHRYGYHAEAQRLSEHFVSLVEQEMGQRGGIFEKYDVEAQTAESKNLTYGYTTNEIGFGWTNGVVSDFVFTLGENTKAAK